MDWFASTGLDEERIVFFLTGLGVGASLLAALQASWTQTPKSQSLDARISRLELRLAARRDYVALARVLLLVEERLPLVASASTVTLFAGRTQPRLRTSSEPDPDQLAREFGDAMHDNTAAAVEIAKTIIDQSVNLNEARDRREVAARVKKLGQALTTAFWDTHGDMMMASNLPKALKDLLQVFFANVRRLKAAVNELAREPSFADLDALLDRAIDLLDIARAIIDELERAASGAHGEVKQQR